MGCHCDNSDDWNDGCNCGDCGSDFGDDEADATIPCPYCGREMYEDAPRCPHCGQYISEEDAPPGRSPWWIILGVVLCLCAIWVWVASQ